MKILKKKKRIVNEIEKASIENMKDRKKYVAFDMFSLDASDLEVLDQIEKTENNGLDISKIIESNSPKKLKEAIDLLNSIRDFDDEIERIRLSGDLFAINKYKEYIEKILKVQGEIINAKIKTENINSIEALGDII